ncbi:hypothetical protein D3C86_1888530 [compost metagenome]
MFPLGAHAGRGPPLACAAIPVVGIAHIGLDPVHQRMHPVESWHAFHRLHDGMRLLPFGADAQFTLLQPPERLQGFAHILGRL